MQLECSKHLSKCSWSAKKRQARAGGATQTVQSLPSKCEVLSSKPSTTKKKQRKEKKKEKAVKTAMDRSEAIYHTVPRAKSSNIHKMV
jgi:hypothetical protein